VPPDVAATDAERVARALVAYGLRGVHLKRRPRADLRRQSALDLAPAGPLAGEAAPTDLTVHEHGMRVTVSLPSGLSTGLFTDQRDNRRLVRELSEGARVLNLFAYTCTFTVAAALGGASETVSVDLSQAALDRGSANLELNGASGPRHRLLRADALSFVARAGRRGAVFDLIVLDPPSFGSAGRRTFSVERDYAPLATQAISLLAPGGRFLAVTNHRKTSLPMLLATLHRAASAAGRSLAGLRELPVPLDHPHRPGGDPPTKSVLVTVV
jgi:23S rRNA (cytosine1962-C5)-methyltransferase